MKLLDKFKGMASVSVADGSSCLLWNDCWMGQPLRLTFAELFSFAKKPLLSLQCAASVTSTSSLFSLPLSTEAFAQFQQIEIILQNLQLSDGVDTWMYIWGSSIFTSRRLSVSYVEEVGHTQSINGFGNPLASISTRSSSSCSLMTD